MFSPTGIPNTVPNNYLFDGDPATSQSFPASNVVVADLGDNENPFTDVRLIFSSTFPGDYPSAATSSVSSNSVAGTGDRRLSKSENVTEVEGMAIPDGAKAVRVWVNKPTSERYLKIYMESGNPFTIHEVVIDFKAKSIPEKL